MRKSTAAKKYVRLVQDMYESYKTGQGLALSLFLFALVMERLTDEVRQESPWTVVFR